MTDKLRTTLRSLALAVLVTSLVANALGVRAALASRRPRDLASAARDTPSERRAALFGADVGEALAALERAVLEARAAGHERIAISYGGGAANVFFSSAMHVAWPMQILEQRSAGSSQKERLDSARRRGATLMISLRPSGGWTATRVESAGNAEGEER